MEQWITYKLGKIAECSLGKMLDQRKNKGKPQMYLGNIAVRWGSFNINPSQTMLFEDHELTKYKLEINDIVICEGGEPGRCAMWKSKDTIYIQKALHRVRVNRNIADPFYVYYYITYLVKSHLLDSYFTGTTIKHLPREQLLSIDIKIPNLATQKKIGNILENIDSKIDLNRRINDNLEQQAQALFKSWFVDFEPFKDGKFVDSEMGMIPEGWKVVQLGDITIQMKDRVGERSDVKVLSPVSTGELLLSEEYFTKQVYSEDISKYILVKPNMFAYNPARVNIGSIGRNKNNFDGCVSPVYVVFSCEENYHYFFDLFRMLPSFKEEVALRAIGGVRQTLKYSDLSMIKTIYPPLYIVLEFNKIMEKLLNIQKMTSMEILNLAEIRDTLLPRLMSGELKINDLNC